MARWQANLNTALHRYANADIVKRDILKVLQNFTDLRANTHNYEPRFYDGTSKQLLCIEGTVPIIVQGDTWNVPMSLQLLDTHPHISPVCYIKPTPPMHVKPGVTILRSGELCHSYLDSWKHPQSDLLDLLETLIAEFEESSPFYIIQNTDADLTNRDILNVTRKFPDLRQTTDTYKCPYGTRKELTCLKGTVPFFIEGDVWNVPLCLWLMDTYPHVPPVCYITPTPPMHIKPGITLLRSGEVFSLNYLDSWKHPQSDLLGLLKRLVVEFEKSPPFYIIQNTDADITNRDILKVTRKFPDLRQTTGTYKCPYGTCKELTCLKGTVPFIIEGDTWNVPLCLWLMDTYPHVPPVCYITPTPPMHIKPGLTLLRSGEVFSLDYLDSWKHPQSDLLGLLKRLVVKFKESPPFYIIQNTDADLTNRDILNITQKFPDLRQSTDTYKCPDGTHKELRCLKGTVPFIIEGDTWNVPLCLWLMDTYPHVPPVCYITPTPPMHIKPGITLLRSGEVFSLNYLDSWQHPESDLMGLLQTLRKEFKRTPPFYIIQNTDADITNRDILNVTQNFTDLRRSTDTYTFDDGSHKKLRCVKGTVPINVKGNVVNMQLCLWLMDDHPHTPPVCYIKPSATVHIKSGYNVDTNGKVYHPYLHKWKHPESDLLELLQILVKEFGKRPPVISVEASQESPRAATAETIVSGVEDVLQCVLCLDNMTDPRVLSCHHSFCKACLKMLLQTRRSRSDRLKCPTCRAVTIVREGSAENLPVDFKMKKLCELLKKHNEGQE